MNKYFRKGCEMVKVTFRKKYYFMLSYINLPLSCDIPWKAQSRPNG